MSLLELFKEKSKKRRELLAQQLGAKSGDDLTSILGNDDRRTSLDSEASGIVGKSGSGKEPEAFVVAKAAVDDGKAGRKRQASGNGGSEDDGEIEDYFKVLKAEEDTYKGSQTFLKVKSMANLFIYQEFSEQLLLLPGNAICQSS